MREIKFPPSESKRRLLEAAEQLFAERGFESVSVRDVTHQAEANVAAVNYHFGSREGLISLVVARHVTPVNDERLLRLDALEKKWPGKVVPVEEVIDAFVRPLVGSARKSELSERLFCKLVARIFSLQGEALPPIVEEQMKSVIDRFLKAFGKSLPGLGPEELVWRFHFVAGAVIHLLLHQEMLFRLSSGASGNPGTDALLGRLIRFASAGLREGLDQETAATAKKGPQAVFDF
jgi:AcrR family transcriptional regulator